jgi:hypothetical protein
MSRGKLILMKTKNPPNWEEWNEIKSRKQYIKERITMIQAEARSILDAVLGSESTEQACEILKTRLPDRKHVTYWLGQIGRRRDVRLGRDLDFDGYIGAVVDRIFNRRPEYLKISEDKKEREMGKKAPKTVIRKGGKSGKATKEPEELGAETVINEESNDSATRETTDLTNSGLAQSPHPGADTQSNNSQAIDISSQQRSNTAPSLSPPISGFDLDGVSLNQQYTVRRMVILCDCCVQKSPEEIFDVLARNFNDTGDLVWWLRKIGKGHLSDLVKGKDIVDAIRKTAHELYQELKKEIGRPIARW